jgi:hypothetical protein
MNTFALIMLAFPFYLATKGRLTVYTKLAAAPANTAAPTAATPPPQTSSVAAGVATGILGAL